MVGVWWRCPAGHEWQETISNRTALLKWKNGDVAACRECVGYTVSNTYPESGCTAMVTPEAAAKKRTRCWNCYQKWYRKNEARLKAELSAVVKAAAGRAGELLETVPLPAHMPAPLATEWQRWASKHLQGAIAAEEILGNEGACEDMLSTAPRWARGRCGRRRTLGGPRPATWCCGCSTQRTERKAGSTSAPGAPRARRWGASMSFVN
ncbi:zinc-ribbon domain-containing protein [Streptomyces sp. NPDC017979]|uniref:zinc-ribbon domain-containing protein n=1 Tax=Streptomyces sp. NPDC017979 TaxID=3365024 RepID=UPI0037BDC520